MLSRLKIILIANMSYGCERMIPDRDPDVFGQITQATAVACRFAGIVLVLVILALGALSWSTL